MKYYSDVLDKLFNTEEELTASEIIHEQEVADAEKKRKEADAMREALGKQKETRRKEVEDAFDKAIELRDKFIDDYGSFNGVIKSDNFYDLFNLLY